MNGQMLTRSILAWHVAGSATALAYINLVVSLPMLFASLLGGAITDRIERRQIIIVGQSLLVVCESVILTLLLLDKLAFWHLLCTGFVAGCIFPFIMPARMAVTVSVVGPQRIQSAMAFSGGIMNLSRVLGPAVMGVVIAQYSVTAAYAVAAVLYAVAVMCMSGVKANHAVPSPGGRKSLGADIWHGLAYVRNNRPLLMCILFGLLPVLVAMPFQNILVILVEQAWQRDESAVGTLIAVGGLGGVLGSVWIVRRGETPKRLGFMVATTLGFALLLGLFAQIANYYVALAVLLVANTFASASQTVNNAIIQILVDDEVRGRISSLMMMSFSLMPVGVFPMAIAADHFGAANAITGGCVVLIAVIVLFFSLSPALRSLDQRVKHRFEPGLS